MKHLLLTLFLAFVGWSGAQAQVKIIVNPGVPEASISAGTLRDIYNLDKIKWSNGSKIVPVTLDAQEGAFFGKIGSGSADMKKVWLRKKLAGEGQPPEALKSDADVVKKVASTPGAVGFVSASAAVDGVKVVATL